MYWETLPSWIWVIFYLFIFTTLGIAIRNVIRKKMISLSIGTILLTITIPLTGTLNSIGRHSGVNEFQHLISELQQGAIWTIYIFIGLLYLLAYWGMFVVKNKKKVSY